MMWLIYKPYFGKANCFSDNLFFASGSLHWFDFGTVHVPEEKQIQQNEVPPAKTPTAYTAMLSDQSLFCQQLHVLC